MRKLKALMVLLLSLRLFNLAAQIPVSFFEEHIDFTLNNTYFTVNGIYSFRNITDKPVVQPIVFPFADKTRFIDSIRVENLSTNTTLAFKRLENSIAFNIQIMPSDTLDLNIFYRQKKTTENKYIITSTQAWKKPLEKAIYTLTADKSIKIKSFSYTPDSHHTKKNKVLYHWNKTDFMPEKDFIVIVEEKKDNVLKNRR